MGRRKSRLYLPVRLARLEPLHRLREPGDVKHTKDRMPKAPERKLAESRRACELLTLF